MNQINNVMETNRRFASSLLNKIISSSFYLRVKHRVGDVIVLLSLEALCFKLHRLQEGVMLLYRELVRRTFKMPFVCNL
jgi:hypothetical protein